MILDVLGELRCRPRPCTGRNARAHPELVQRALAEGHHVGYYSASHPDPAELPPHALSAE